MQTEEQANKEFEVDVNNFKALGGSAPAGSDAAGESA
jgi:hypothetical protein